MTCSWVVAGTANFKFIGTTKCCIGAGVMDFQCFVCVD